jgi:hypothetical protein
MENDRETKQLRHHMKHLSLSARSCSWAISVGANTPFVQVIHPHTDMGDKKQKIYNLFAAYLHTVPLEVLIESIERARRESQLRHIVFYGATCSYCLSRAKRLDGSYLRSY